MLPKALIAIAVALGSLAVLAPPTEAQEIPAVESYRLDYERSRIDIPLEAGQGNIEILFRDLSLDSPGAHVPGTSGGAPHYVRVQVQPVEQKSGWIASATPVQFTSYGGSEKPIRLQFLVSPLADDPYFRVNLTVHIRDLQGQEFMLEESFLAYSPGRATFTALVGGSVQIGPGDIQDLDVRIRNNALVPRSFDIEVADNPCGIETAATKGNIVPGDATETFTVTLRGPEKRFWYNYESCTLSLRVMPTDNENQATTKAVSVQLNGFYFNPLWGFWSFVVALAIALFALLAKRGKERREEEILGKPQKPWTIPIETLYLKRLKEKDERAWYMVRHHLMEDEYRSALMWYHAYKKATKADRTKETVILREEQAYRRWQRSWEKAIETPLQDADRMEAKLQRQADHEARKQHRQALRKWRRNTKKLRADHEQRVEKAVAKWEKQKAKAEKKGRPAPDKPDLPAPDYGEKPEPHPIALADHKLAKRAAKFRQKMERKQGTLEVKYEKADVRRRRRAIKKMRKLARKLDDPDFVEHHPMLSEGA